jgi:GTPase SAR1 family protein
MVKRELKYSILGLDNAGKSSLLYALQKIYGFEKKVEAIRPTIRINHVEFKVLDTIIRFWDFGGQNTYRERYLAEPHLFDQTNILLYLIDLQDETRFNESITYLANILETIKEFPENHSYPINICFSKCDLPLLNNKIADYQDRIDMLEKLIETTYPNYNFKFFTTSIYNLYSIIRLFSQTLQAFLPIAKDLHEILVNFCQTNKCMQGFFFDPSGIALSDCTTIPTDQSDLLNPTIEIINAYIRIYRQFDENAVKMPFTHHAHENYKIFCLQFQLHPKDSNIPIKTIEKEKKKNNPLFLNYYLTLFCTDKCSNLCEPTAFEPVLEKCSQLLFKYLNVN